MKAYTKIKIKLFLFDFTFNLIVFSLIGIFAYLNDKIIETILFYVAWLFVRYAFPKIFHFKQSKTAILNILGCLFWSVLIFYVVIRHLFPVSISIFMSVIISVGVNYILYKIQDYIDLKLYFARNSKFSIETATKEQIEKCCNLLHYKKDKTTLAILFFVEKLSNEQVWNYMLKNKQNVELDTVRQYRYRILKDLNKFIKEENKLDTH